jgi:serine protease inhibitor
MSMLLQKRDWRILSIAGALWVAAATLAGCGGSTAGPDNPAKSPAAVLPAAVAKAKADNTEVSPSIVVADNTFGLSALRTLQAQNSSRSIAISPLSLSLALQVLYNGAAGDTQAAMTQTLQLGALTKQQMNDANAALQAALSSADPQVELKIANSLWLHLDHTTVVPSFTEMDQNYYGAMIGDLAGAPDNVNAWVASETNGLIPQVLPQDDYSRVPAVIANAVYFKGRWTSTFDPNSTRSAPFTLNDGTSTSVHMMHQSSTFAYLRGPDFQMVRLPYGQGRMSMLILLPDPGNSLGTFLDHLTADGLDTSVDQMQVSYGSVALPRFTGQSNSNMRPVLDALGMGIAFNCPEVLATGPSADFSALTSEQVCVTRVAHNAWVEVDEIGTVAAAATTITIGTTSIPQQQFAMTVDHPFLYAIRDDDTGALLFIGTMLDPPN